MRITLLISICLLVLVVSGWTTSSAPTYEYKFVYQCDEKKTNSLSADGWELSQMSMASHGSIGVATCVFKRSK